MHLKPSCSQKRGNETNSVNGYCTGIRTGERGDRENVSRQHTVCENAPQHLHAHTAAQHDQLDRAGEVTPIVAVLDNRWEENLSAEEEEKSRTLSLSLCLSLSFRMVSLQNMLHLCCHVCLHRAAPASISDGSTGCMLWLLDRTGFSLYSHQC